MHLIYFGNLTLKIIFQKTHSRVHLVCSRNIVLKILFRNLGNPDLEIIENLFFEDFNK